MKKENAEIVLVMNNVRSTHNVGSALRTADGFGVSTLYCVGYTPGARDRFGRKRRDVAKVALGAEETVAIVHVDTFETLASALRDDGYRIVGLEQGPHALPLCKVTKAPRLALVAGNEVDGLDLETQRLCDEVVEIPMRGTKESLNVSVAIGIALYELCRVE